MRLFYIKPANVCKRFFQDFSRIEAKHRKAGGPDADAARDRELLALYDKYARKYGLEW